MTHVLTITPRAPHMKHDICVNYIMKKGDVISKGIYEDMIYDSEKTHFLQ